MSFYNSVKLIINTIVIVIFIVVFLWFYHEYKVNRLNKRLTKYAISKDSERHSLFDIIVSFYVKVRTKFKKVLAKSSDLRKYSIKYEKYLNKENKLIKDGMDYVTTKFILGFAFIFILLVSTFLQNDHVTISRIIIAFSLGFFSLDIFLLTKKKYINYWMKNDLLKTITIMNNCFKSGRSIVQTIEIVAKEIDGPLKKEFEKMSEDLNYGLEIEVVFERFNKRVDLKEVKYITTSLTILNKTGGNIIDVFDSIEKTIFNNKKLEDELKNLSAASKALYQILVFIPIIFTLVIFILDSTYFMPLFVNPLGILIIVLILVIYVSYIILVKRIMRLKEY